MFGEVVRLLLGGGGLVVGSWWDGGREGRGDW